MKKSKIKLNEIFRTITQGRHYHINRTFTLPKKNKEPITPQTSNREIRMNSNSRTIQLAVRYRLNSVYYRLHKKKKDSIICQKDDNSNVEEQKAYIKKKNFYYKSSYIDSIKF